MINFLLTLYNEFYSSSAAGWTGIHIHTRTQSRPLRIKVRHSKLLELNKIDSFFCFREELSFLNFELRIECFPVAVLISVKHV